MPPLLELCVPLALALICARFLLRKKSRVLPPGPKGWPVIGNLLDLPSTYPWLKYTEWARKYDSDITHLSLPGAHIVILHSAEVANELCEKRSSKYSDRPFLTMLCDPKLLDLLDWSFVLMPYASAWRDCRKMFHQHFHARAVAAYRPKERRATQHFLGTLLAEPAHFAENLRVMAGEIILDLAYGIKVKGADDPYVQLAEAANGGAIQAGQSGKFLVDALSFLKYVPAWVPGAGFKRKAAEWRQINADMFNKPYEMVKQQMAAGAAPESILKSALEARDGTPDEYTEWVAKRVTGIMYATGSDTTISVLHTFFLAMTLHPAVQRAAQAELDRVLAPPAGHLRLPDFSDMDAGYFPYISAIMHECARWYAPLPLGIPHCTTEDDVFAGYFIPKGSIVLTNIWAMSRDPQVYSNPSAFDPTRFLGPTPEHEPGFVFGFGRRVCPGKHMAVESMWLTIACVLAAFDIAPDGEPPKEEYVSALAIQPLPFKCKITPRSDAAARVVDAAAKAAEAERGG